MLFGQAPRLNEACCQRVAGTRFHIELTEIFLVKFSVCSGSWQLEAFSGESHRVVETGDTAQCTSIYMIISYRKL